MIDTTTRKNLIPPLEHQFEVTYLAWDEGAKQILTGTVDGTARVWDSTTGQPITPQLRHQIKIFGWSWGPNIVLTDGERKYRWVWDLAPDDRPSEDWVALMQLLSCRRTEDPGTLGPLSREEIDQAWNKLRKRYPKDFTVTAEQVIVWHRREMEDCIRERNPAAAVFHAWHAFPEFHLLWGMPRP
jgi:WD40 repeat protein